MRFSIITTTFNAEEFLAKTIESVAMQRFSSFEHLIWDGGSQDGTIEIAKRMGVNVYQGADCGIADAMNKGAAKARGDILLHLHADDYLLHPHVLSFVDSVFKQHPQARWLYGQAEIVDKEGKLVKRPPFVPFDRRRLLRYNIISHPATFIERRLFEESGGFDPNFRYSMDYELWLRLSKRSAPFALPAYLTAFRTHAGSLSTREQVGVADEAYKARNQHLRFWQRYRSYRTWRKRRVACS